MARGDLEDPTIAQIAKDHETHPANVVLSWAISRHTIPLPKSANPERINSNLKTIDLSAEEQKSIDSIAAAAPEKRLYKYAGPYKAF